nr:uncharacterized protein LOC115841285 [Globicephala melas]
MRRDENGETSLEAPPTVYVKDKHVLDLDNIDTLIIVEPLKRGKFTVRPGDDPHPRIPGRCAPPSRALHCPSARRPREGRRGVAGQRAGGRGRGRSRGQDEEAAPLRAAGPRGLRRSGTERRGRRARPPGPRTHQGGRAGSGRPHSGDPVERSPPPRPRPRWEARRDGPAASLPPQLSPSYKYRLGPHPSPPTPGALRKVRRPRAGQREREGDSAAQTAPAPAVRQLPQLEAWPPAAPAPALPLPPLGPAPRPDSSPRVLRRSRAARAGPSSAEPVAAATGGDRLRYPEG